MEYVKSSDSVDFVVETYPQVVKFFSEKGIVCVQCGEPLWGTLEDIIKKKNYDVDTIIKELNEFIENIIRN